MILSPVLVPGNHIPVEPSGSVQQVFPTRVNTVSHGAGIHSPSSDHNAKGTRSRLHLGASSPGFRRMHSPWGKGGGAFKHIRLFFKGQRLGKVGLTCPPWPAGRPTQPRLEDLQSLSHFTAPPTSPDQCCLKHPIPLQEHPQALSHTGRASRSSGCLRREGQAGRLPGLPGWRLGAPPWGRFLQDRCSPTRVP